MREPRPGLPWSKQRVARRAAYATWMASAAWQRRRKAWHANWVAAHRAEPVCAVCDTAWTLRHGDLHHRTYTRLGHEADRDLIPLCRACHDRLHQLLDATPGWRRLPRPQATDLLVAHLRKNRP